MSRRTPIVPGEWYHCYTRGVDKRITFQSPADHERFLIHLYAGNATNSIRISNLRDRQLLSVLTNSSIERGWPLVDIGAYSLMPNHFHAVLRERSERGIAKFMQKVFTGYTQYFNNKYGRTGSLFSGTYKSKHVLDDRYLKQVVAYVLLNPAELFDFAWKDGTSDLLFIKEKLLAYPYSSLPDFFGIERLEKRIVGDFLLDYYDQRPELTNMLQAAKEYYREQGLTAG